MKVKMKTKKNQKQLCGLLGYLRLKRWGLFHPIRINVHCVLLLVIISIVLLMCVSLTLLLYVMHLIVETLFEVFCECAELNPEPMEGKKFVKSIAIVFFCKDNLLLLAFSYCCLFCWFDFYYWITFHFLSGLRMHYLDEDGERHNWIFSADQLNGQGLGKDRW